LSLGWDRPVERLVLLVMASSAFSTKVVIIFGFLYLLF